MQSRKCEIEQTAIRQPAGQGAINLKEMTLPKMKILRTKIALYKTLLELSHLLDEDDLELMSILAGDRDVQGTLEYWRKHGH